MRLLVAHLVRAVIRNHDVLNSCVSAIEPNFCVFASLQRVWVMGS